jgi:hypothetical protein
MIRIGVRSFVAGGGAAPYVGLLDTYTDAYIAYSVRLLRSAYTGSAIRVRRSSDNTEQDIGFDVSGNLDESALTTFVGANNGFVTTWYDQSGNARNATQSTAINQPQIVSNGTVLKRNSQPILQTNGQSVLYTASSALEGRLQSIFFTLYKASTNASVAMMSTGDTQYFPLRLATGADRFYNSSVNITAPILPTALNLISIFQNTNTLVGSAYENSTLLANYTTLSKLFGGQHTLFGRFTNLNLLPNQYGIPEVIIYASDKSSDRTGIESNINSYYGIY